MTSVTFVRYLLVGASNTLLDLGLFILLAVAIQVPALVANIISTSITVGVSYVLNRLFVFRSQRSVQSTLLQFVAVTLVSGLVVQSVAIWAVLVLGSAADPSLSSTALAPLAKVCAMGVGMCCNYLGYRWLFHAQAPVSSQNPRADDRDPE